MFGRPRRPPVSFDVIIRDEATENQYGYPASSLSFKSEKPVVFGCEFCEKDFVSSFKSVRRSPGSACKSCNSLSAAWTMTKSILSKREFFLSKQVVRRDDVIDASATMAKFGYGPASLATGSSKKVVASCEFCRNPFDAIMNVIHNGSGLVACKGCDAVASSYSRFGGVGDKAEFLASRRPTTDQSCLDVAGTMAEFGYDPTLLPSFSSKRVRVNCKFCRCSLIIPMSKFTSRDGRVTCWGCMRKKTVETLQDKYGVSSTLSIPSVIEKLEDPSTEQVVASVLRDRYGLDFIRQYPVGPYSFDFFVPSINLLIECHGDYFHDFKANGYSGTPKDRAKSSYAEKFSPHKIVWIFEHEIHLGRINKILDFHVHGARDEVVSFELKELEFRSIPSKDAHSFLSQYHYLGNLGTVSSPYGAFFGDTLVAVCAFGGVTRNQTIRKVNESIHGSSLGPKDLRELRRFCIRPNVPVKNLASYCLARFSKLYKEEHPNVLACISFSDQTVQDVGTIYAASNWKKLHKTGKSYHYFDVKSHKAIHKKTVWDLAKSAHMKEVEFARSAGLKLIKEEPKTLWYKDL